MRSIGDTAVDPRPGDCVEHQGLVFEVVYVEPDRVVYRAFPAVPKRARWMTRHGWRTLCRSGSEISEYTSEPSTESKS